LQHGTRSSHATENFSLSVRFLGINFTLFPEKRIDRQSPFGLNTAANLFVFTSVSSIANNNLLWILKILVIKTYRHILPHILLCTMKKGVGIMDGQM
jgi:hypothetical protein